ncbi:RING-H2 finger protein ATL66-like [Phragmites australis]|uniref:RING-H2 finger protein ATL66-like n=1 Tax=Phragmites australis TaxID=29695 RepID=UPI002D79699C|nr:RING-H2 finger protein ATL66-like [Phragmites australis]
MATQEALQPLGWRYGDGDDGNFVVRCRSVPLLVALFGVLVCFVAVCLYLRWTCHRYNNRDAATLPTYYWASSAAAPASTASVNGLDDATIAGLPVRLYRPSGAGADDAAQCCSICLGEFAEGEKVKTLPRCGHGFHPECVDVWLRARASCPLCRASLLAAAATTKLDVVGSEAV